MRSLRCMGLAFLVLFTANVAAGEPANEAKVSAENPVGWRGNWTGRFPDAHPPTEWSRTSKSPVSQLSYSAKRPSGGDATGAFRPASQALVNWLVMGPFKPKDPALALDEEFVPNEAALAPDEGEKAGDAIWTAYSKKSIEELSSVGQDGAPENYKNGLDFREVLPKETVKTLHDEVAYAHVYLYSPRDGKVALALSHAGGIKIWVNGQVAYSNTKPEYSYCVNHWQYFTFGWHSEPWGAATFVQAPAMVNVELKKGWNRVLFKIAFCSTCLGDFMFMDFRLTAPADAGYESKNIVWETALPSRGVSGPIVVGDKIFLTMEVDELACINKSDGKILWRRSNTLYDATPEADRALNPLFKEIEPLNAKIPLAENFVEVLKLHKQIHELLNKIDAKKYAWGDVRTAPFTGNATPTPCSDGKNVYAFFGNSGVVACYDLLGNRKWIGNTGGAAGDYNTQSPLLAGNVFFVNRSGVGSAYDKETGKVLWTVKVDEDCNTPIAVKVGGVDLIVAGRVGEVFRVSDGKCVGAIGPAHHATPVCVEGNHIFRVSMDKEFLGQTLSLQSDALKVESMMRSPSPFQGLSLDTPLFSGGMVYDINAFGNVVAWSVGETEAKVAFSAQRLEGMHPLNQIWNFIFGATASPMLGGKNIYFMDNQGTTVVIEPGSQLKTVAVNKIENYLPRRWVTATQEQTYTSPICDGNRMLIRGEETLYCIGEK
jgi:outer membrane protein assembly factor BamB